ncbi:hypothetical protein E2542_SST04359 [Spatholobus suberectus]|nr:hypothetical protein E2542_SST04359 [Spatholobus suberectus]
MRDEGGYEVMKKAVEKLRLRQGALQHIEKAMRHASLENTETAVLTSAPSLGHLNQLMITQARHRDALAKMNLLG